MLKGMQLHHNFIRPHQGLDGDTPADREGIRIMAATSGRRSSRTRQSRQFPTLSTRIQLPLSYQYRIEALINDITVL